MKNFLVALDVVLLLAVGVLFYLFFSNKSPKGTGVVSVHTADSTSAASFKIVYFESDSLEKQYEYYKEVRGAIRQKDEENVRQLTALRNKYSGIVKEYQQRGNSMTQAEQVAAQQSIEQMDADYRNTDQRLQQEIQAESMRRLQEVKNKIQEFLKDYAKERNYAFVFGSNEYDYLYYKDSTRDITADVVRMLNDRYKAEKSTKKK